MVWPRRQRGGARRARRCSSKRRPRRANGGCFETDGESARVPMAQKCGRAGSVSCGTAMAESTSCQVSGIFRTKDGRFLLLF